ncbi:hypothetical protein [Rhizobium sp. RCAM05973]|uniref:hypothetical protein n=1 Tax=Rhizobium sp. RCAM05973 TaxID=2994066 RepID=UPI0022EBE16D|nr:hypothetical protein [Rhizobium sp. RCAM05973]
MANGEQFGSGPGTTNSAMPLPRYVRFAIGGAGGLLPVLALLVSADIDAIQKVYDNHLWTTGLCIGWGIRTIALFVLGGLMALLNSDIIKPFALVQIGIAAPALVASYASGNALMDARDAKPAIVAPGQTSTIEQLFFQLPMEPTTINERSPKSRSPAFSTM